jgi:hypothetical protein
VVPISHSADQSDHDHVTRLREDVFPDHYWAYSSLQYYNADIGGIFCTLPVVASAASGKMKTTKRTDTNPKDEKENFEETVGKSRPETARSPRSRIKCRTNIIRC